MEQFSIEKHLNNFIKGEFAVNCRTDDLANEFLNYCHKSNLTWCSGEELTGNNEWGKYQEETSYFYDKYGMEFSPANYYEKNRGLIIIEFTGFNSDTYKINKPQKLTKEMINCLRMPHTKFRDWYGSCLDCEIHKLDKVVRDENNVCTIAVNCLKWLEIINK